GGRLDHCSRRGAHQAAPGPRRRGAGEGRGRGGRGGGGLGGGLWGRAAVRGPDDRPPDRGLLPRGAGAGGSRGRFREHRRSHRGHRAHAVGRRSSPSSLGGGGGKDPQKAGKRPPGGWTLSKRCLAAGRQGSTLEVLLLLPPRNLSKPV